METRRLNVVITLPLLMIGFVLILSFFSTYSNLIFAIREDPARTVLRCFHLINTGQLSAASSFLGQQAADIDLSMMQNRLHHDYGAPVFTSASVSVQTKQQAAVWSDSYSAKGHRYIIDWKVTWQNERWMITEISELKESMLE